MIKFSGYIKEDPIEEQKNENVLADQTGEKEFENGQVNLTGKQLVDEVIEQSEEIGIRADEISSANKEIKQFEIEFSQQQQSQPNIGIGIGE